MVQSDEKTLEWINGCNDPNALRTFADNAERKGRSDLRDIALARSWRLAGRGHSDSLARDFHSMLAAYEHYLYQKHGKHVRASYTRRALKDKGIKATLIDWALSPKATPGFLSLIAAKLPEFTGECVVVRHAEEFSEDVVRAARRRLEEYGVTNCDEESP